MNSAAAEAAPAATFVTPDGLLIRRDWLVGGIALLRATGEQIPAGATGHAIA